MADITMCNDSECPRCGTCWRFNAPKSSFQSMFAESPRKGDECKYYWQMKDQVSEWKEYT
jgi:lipoate synthase